MAFDQPDGRQFFSQFRCNARQPDGSFARDWLPTDLRPKQRFDVPTDALCGSPVDLPGGKLVGTALPDESGTARKRSAETVAAGADEQLRP
jgi:hypothetical protein